MEILNPRVDKEQTIEAVEIKKLNIRDRSGEEVPTSCIEFTVVGKNNGRKWRDFLTMEEFLGANPDAMEELINKQ